MTRDTTITDELAAVEQCDRDAAAEIFMLLGRENSAKLAVIGRGGDGPVTKILARHRRPTHPKETPTEQGEVARKAQSFSEGVMNLVHGSFDCDGVPNSTWEELSGQLYDLALAALSHPVSTNIQVAAHPIIREIMAEVEKATRKFPTWPTRIIDAGNVLSEEAGEVAKAILQCVYEPHKSGLDDVREEVVQTAAMCFRFLASMGRYDLSEGPQHHQKPLAKSDCLQCGNNPAAVELCDDCERTFLSTITASSTTEGGGE